MGILVNIYKHPLGNCTNGGQSADPTIKGFCVMDVDGPFEPSADYPLAYIVDKRPMGRPYPHLKPASIPAGKWNMFGGNYAGTSDSRWTRHVEAISGSPYSLLPIFDRVEG